MNKIEENATTVLSYFRKRFYSISSQSKDDKQYNLIVDTSDTYFHARIEIEEDLNKCRATMSYFGLWDIDIRGKTRIWNSPDIWRDQSNIEYAVEKGNLIIRYNRYNCEYPEYLEDPTRENEEFKAPITHSLENSTDTILSYFENHQYSVLTHSEDKKHYDMIKNVDNNTLHAYLDLNAELDRCYISFAHYWRYDLEFWSTPVMWGSSLLWKNPTAILDIIKRLG